MVEVFPSVRRRREAASAMACSACSDCRVDAAAGGGNFMEAGTRTPAAIGAGHSPLNFLSQNCIRLKLYKIKIRPFRVRPLNFLIQNVRPFTTPTQPQGDPRDGDAHTNCSPMPATARAHAQPRGKFTKPHGEAALPCPGFTKPVGTGPV